MAAIVDGLRQSRDEKKRLGRGVEYGSLAAAAATRQVWPSA
jgi:hypothetical protein